VRDLKIEEVEKMGLRPVGKKTAVEKTVVLCQFEVKFNPDSNLSGPLCAGHEPCVGFPPRLHTSQRVWGGLEGAIAQGA
jgi:hypothetical protein